MLGHDEARSIDDRIGGFASRLAGACADPDAWI